MSHFKKLFIQLTSKQSFLHKEQHARAHCLRTITTRHSLVSNPLKFLTFIYYIYFFSVNLCVIRQTLCSAHWMTNSLFQVSGHPEHKIYFLMSMLPKICHGDVSGDHKSTNNLPSTMFGNSSLKTEKRDGAAQVRAQIFTSSWKYPKSSWMVNNIPDY